MRLLFRSSERSEERRTAGEEGFEPSNGGFRVHCLTTWLLP
ncbi:MAG: hypothetical protein ACD_41C00299G0015, partial [uncultured bacterium]